MATFDVQVLPHQGRVRIVVVGKAGVDLFGAAFNAVLDDPDFSPGMDTLWNLMNADVSSISIEEIQSIVDMVEINAQRRGAGRVAIVAERDVDFGVSRIYQALASDLDTSVAVFRAVADAEAWFDRGSGRDGPG